ncbi:class A sortase [Lactobacillus iners]|uniref:class A sortase n=1 Tax=Lactobacillus iners TaxID=147802 RepID=UPI0001E5DBBC|nr:sortase family protein [Lactobacillus iners LactinV 03V1-b]MCT7689970.1 class A sortase [Lactobacillus crispatus]MCT7739193.1 class A sortase [Lactobacillus iners]
MNQSRKDLRKTSKRNYKKVILNIGIGLIIALIIGAIIVVLNFDKLQGNAAHNLQNTALRIGKTNKQRKNPSFNFSDVKPISPASLAYAYAHQKDYRAIGQITIPKWHINLNIYKGVGNTELNLGAGTMKPNQVMGKGNYALAGHNMDDGRSYFSPLYTAKVRGYLGSDTTIMLTDYKNVYFYKTIESTFISRNRIDLIDDKPEFIKNPVISLFTCDYTGAGRLFVRGKLTGMQSFSSASNYVKNAFLLN